MKLLKKLLPLATIASTAAVVAPMVTSCAGVAGTSDFDYKPTEQHAEAEIKTVDEYNTLVKDYFSKPSRMANDFVYETSSSAAEQKKSLEKSKEAKLIDSFELNFNASVKSFKIKEYKELDLGTLYGGKVSSYVVDCSISYSNYEKIVGIENTEKHTKVTTETEESVSASFTNVFAVIDPSTKGIWLFTHKDLDWTAEMTYQEIITNTTEMTKTGHKTVVKNVENRNYYNDKKDSPESISPAQGIYKSYYLEKVTFSL